MLGTRKDKYNPFVVFVHYKDIHHRFVFTGLYISKQFADQYKPEMPAITVSALMNGYGRQLADFLKPCDQIRYSKLNSSIIK